MPDAPKITTYQPYATTNSNKRSLGLGDRIEKLVKPIARALKMKCLDEKTEQLKPESPCAKRRNAVNEIGRAIGIGV